MLARVADVHFETDVVTRVVWPTTHADLMLIRRKKHPVADGRVLLVSETPRDRSESVDGCLKNDLTSAQVALRLDAVLVCSLMLGLGL